MGAFMNFRSLVLPQNTSHRSVTELIIEVGKSLAVDSRVFPAVGVVTDMRGRIVVSAMIGKPHGRARWQKAKSSARFRSKSAEHDCGCV